MHYITYANYKTCTICKTLVYTIEYTYYTILQYIDMYIQNIT